MFHCIGSTFHRCPRSRTLSFTLPVFVWTILDSTSRILDFSSVLCLNVVCFPRLLVPAELEAALALIWASNAAFSSCCLTRRDCRSSCCNFQDFCRNLPDVRVITNWYGVCMWAARASYLTLCWAWRSCSKRSGSREQRLVLEFDFANTTKLSVVSCAVSLYSLSLLWNVECP